MARCMVDAESHCKLYPRCYGCNAFRNPTNADRIRSMSDEELAMCLYEVGYDEGWDKPEYALKWLQQPAEEAEWKVPAADVAPDRHGKWECQKPCPVCGEDRFKGLDADIWSDWEPPYCPNCGAKMGGVNNGEEKQ